MNPDGQPLEDLDDSSQLSRSMTDAESDVTTTNASNSALAGGEFSHPLRSLNISPVGSDGTNADETASIETISDVSAEAGSPMEVEDEAGLYTPLAAGGLGAMAVGSSGVGPTLLPHHSYNLRSRENRDPYAASSTPKFAPHVKMVEKPPLELPTYTRLKVKIKKLKIVGEWKWLEGQGDSCGICRNRFEGCCVDCRTPGDDCPLVVGQCRHPFHMHCIVKWTNSQAGQQRPACPLCRQEWKFAN